MLEPGKRNENLLKRGPCRIEISNLFCFNQMRHNLKYLGQFNLIIQFHVRFKQMCLQFRLALMRDTERARQFSF